VGDLRNKDAAGCDSRGGHELQPAAVVSSEGVTRQIGRCNRRASFESSNFEARGVLLRG